MFSRFMRRYRSSLVITILSSCLLNLLTFAGSFYMLLVYDSVLPSRSAQTLFGLFLMLILVYGFQIIFEGIRSAAMLAIANGVRRDLFHAVHYATVTRPLRTGRVDGDGMQAMRDLDQIHSFLASPGPLALIDLPWVILFLIVLATLHWALGLTALLGTLVLVGIAIATARRTQAGTQELTQVTGRRSAAALAELRFAEAAAVMGMQERLLARTAVWDDEFVRAQTFLSRTVSRLGGLGRSCRLFLQSLILTVGALLVLDGQASGGVILASSVLSGRALAPVDLAIANWRNLAAARAGWARIMDAISTFRLPPARTIALAPPARELAVRDIWVPAPGTQNFILSGISFALKPGQVLAIIGPSAAGKTSLAKTLLGLWRPARGEIRLDGATYSQWDAEALGASLGYVPQNVELIDGTVGENIARFDPNATSEAVIAAARAAGLHEIILALPDGYDTRLSPGGFDLSAGQRQRVGLARALYGDPFLLVLDEANSNLDAAGDAALSAAIETVKARGGIVVMVTHRPAGLGPVTHIAVLQGGRLAEFGERDVILAKLHPQQSAQKPKPSLQPAEGKLS